MTPEEIELMREIAGLNEPNYRAAEKAWGDSMIKSGQPKIENQIPEPSIDNFNLTHVGTTDHNLINTANRLNNLLGSDFGNSIKIERLN